jgi:hypothetical protein
MRRVPTQLRSAVSGGVLRRAPLGARRAGRAAIKIGPTLAGHSPPGVTSAREGPGGPEGYRARDGLRRRRSRARWLSVVFALNAASRAWSARDPRPGSKPIWRAKVAPS